MSSAFSWVLDEHIVVQSEDDHFFLQALKNAHWASGSTHPNPSVGAVIVCDGRIIADGHTEKPGCMHAEKQALHRSQEDVTGATLYVTLEPCCHMGRTPPCTDAIIKAGIRRVVYGVKDPNPLVAGKGIKQLLDAGIKVDEIQNPLLREEAHNAIKPFYFYILKKRPFVVVKIATSDDYALSKLGHRVKITGSESDKVVHQLRRAVDAVMVGANTVRIDNPHLLVQLGKKNHGQQPLRVVLSHDLNLDSEAHILDTTKAPTWIFSDEFEARKTKPFTEKGVDIISLEYLSLNRVLDELASRGITSLLVEAGQSLLMSFIQEKLIDEVWWFQSASRIGSDGLFINQHLNALNLMNEPRRIIGSDRLVIASVGMNNL